QAEPAVRATGGEGGGVGPTVRVAAAVLGSADPATTRARTRRTASAGPRRATRRGSPAAASPTTARQIERRPPSASRSAHAQQLLPQPLLHRHYAEPPLPHQGEVL